MLESVLLGSLLIGATVIVHALGTFAGVTWVRRHALSSASVIHSVRVLIVTVLAIFLMHTIEVVIWALAYLLHGRIDDLQTFEEAVYFSMVTYTTVGFGDITLSGDLRLLAGIQGLNGILLFGWSTALLIGMVQRLLAGPSTREPAARA